MRVLRGRLLSVLGEEFDRVVGFDGGFFDDFGDPAGAADDDFREFGVELFQVGAGDSDVGDFDRAGADFETIAVLEGVKIEALGGEVFTDGAVGQVDAIFAEPVVEFVTEEADGAIGTAVVFFVALAVAFEAVFGDAGVEDGLLGHAAV